MLNIFFFFDLLVLLSLFSNLSFSLPLSFPSSPHIIIHNSIHTFIISTYDTQTNTHTNNKGDCIEARLTTLFLLCLALNSVSATLASTPGVKRANDVLFYEDGKTYSYCEADHPTVDTYPDPPVWILFLSIILHSFMRKRIRAHGTQKINISIDLPFFPIFASCLFTVSHI